jgi:hypothetical protein
MTEKNTYVTREGVKEFWWESSPNYPDIYTLLVSGRRCGSVFFGPTIVDKSVAPMTPGRSWVAEVEGAFEKKILGISGRTTSGRWVIGAYRTKEEAQRAVEDVLLPVQNSRSSMQLSEYQKLRRAQKNGLIVFVGSSALWLGLGVWAGVGKWWWAIPFCAFFTYYSVACTYLTYRLRKKGGSPFSPSREEVFKWMFTFKVEKHRDKATEEKSAILPGVGRERMNGGKLQPMVGKNIGPNDPCPCGSGKKYKHCCGR